MTVSGDKEDIKSNGANGIRNLTPTDYVGFESLPEQYVNRTIREGFVFNVLVLGATGVGKSTLIDSLFNTKFPDVSTKSHNSQTVELHVQTHELQEKQIKLKLTIVESRGFGDQINKGESYKSIVEYIDNQFERYLQEELKIHRSNNLGSQDTRIHCCLYLISPIGHGLRAIDLITLKKLDSKVNIIPIIAKADIITKNELSKLRSKIMEEIITNGIQIYHFPADDPEIAENNLLTNGILPFAVVASHDFVRLGNKQVRARQYPWGTVQVENENHCDFVKLREMLLRINMEDLRETTQTKHYEVYRRTRLEEMGFGDVVDTAKASTFQESYEASRKNQNADISKKEEEARQRFVLRAREKERQLESFERELHIRKAAQTKKRGEEYELYKKEMEKLEEQIEEMQRKKDTALEEIRLLSGTANSNHSTSSLNTLLGTLSRSKKK